MEFMDSRFFDHFIDPKNVGTIKDPDGTGMGGDGSCGDWLIVMIKVKDEVITDIKFQCRGCSAAIVTSSAMTEMAKGKTIEEAMKISAKMIEDEVGGLSDEKRHCSLLGEEALRQAIEDYLGKH
ncbi:MAG: iron-sulfur cluster assembly scaffold protein [Candidatus Krumholzibacteriota bacterium]|nr:iron-sulfur cluster assembly scaffold protein [Candidatus Krumholzibacteriota bacterium]